MNYEGLAEIATYEAWYYRKKYEETLDRLHQCKRRNREDKVKLRNKYDKEIKELQRLNELPRYSRVF